MVSVRNEETDLVREYLIPQGKHLVVYEGDRVGVGEAITDGAINPHDILHVKGVKEVQEFLVNAIQEVYRLQGVNISDRHIECIVRQMLENVKIVNSGDTPFLKGEIVNRFTFADDNRADQGQGRQRSPGRAGAPGHHQGLAGIQLLRLRGELPGDDARPHRGRDHVEDRLPQGPEGERHHRPHDSGRHGPAGPREAPGASARPQAEAKQ